MFAFGNPELGCSQCGACAFPSQWPSSTIGMPCTSGYRFLDQLHWALHNVVGPARPLLGTCCADL